MYVNPEVVHRIQDEIKTLENVRDRLKYKGCGHQQILDQLERLQQALKCLTV